MGLVSDAGMPGISDPGHVVVAAAVAAGVRVVALPGPCAFVTALVGSGLSTDNFTFAGFLPPKSGASDGHFLPSNQPPHLRGLPVVFSFWYLDKYHALLYHHANNDHDIGNVTGCSSHCSEQDLRFTYILLISFPSCFYLSPSEEVSPPSVLLHQAPDWFISYVPSPHETSSRIQPLCPSL